MRSFMIHTTPQILIRVIKSRRMRWAGHVVYMENRRGVYRVLVRPHRKSSLEDLAINGRIIL
jgi:hypothetical protein